jgi:hypothetical protein
MAPRKNAKGLSPAPSTPARRPSLVASSPEKPPGPLSTTISPEEREIIKVNNYSVSELKNACDDALKRVRSFNESKLTTNAHITYHCSTYRDPFCSNKYIFTLMCDWLWDGRAYSLQQLRDFMGGKLTSKSRSQEFGLVSYCKSSL